MRPGIGFWQVPRGVWRRSRRVWIPTEMESSHMIIMGDTGSGKSVLQRQILTQIQDRGEVAIVYDPAGEFAREFYQPGRGDIIMNPLDERAPFWTPADEILIDAEALTLAQSLYPVKPLEQSFFSEAPQRIMNIVLIQRRDPDYIVHLLTHDDELDALVANTPAAAMIDRAAGAGGQRAGVLASLNMVADALMLLPSPAGRRRWSATEWSRHRRGWVFFTSTPETRARMLPLTSLWLDYLVLRLMNQHYEGEHALPKAWFVLDELASLQRLPQLHTAITEARKSGCPLVLAFQNRSQIEARYGHDADAMLSQPATKVFLRSSEARSSEWASKMIGQMEIERIREGRSDSVAADLHGRRSASRSLERQVESVVLASEIQGLPNLHGFLKFGNYVTRMHVQYQPPALHHPSYLPRPDVATAGTPAKFQQQRSTQPAVRWS